MAIGAMCFTAAPGAETDHTKVIVFPLYSSSENESIAWVGEGIAESLSAQLRDPQVGVMERGQVTELMEDMGFFRGAQLSLGSMIGIAQKASANLAVIGTFDGTERDIAISVRVFYLEKLKLSGSISANGPLSALPQVENELAWQILTEIGLERSTSREKYFERARKIPNSAFKIYIQGLGSPNENDQRRLLLKAVEAYDNFPQAHLELGNLYYRQGDCKSALTHLMRAGREGDYPLKVDFIMGACYIKTEQPQLAIEAYSKILRDVRPFEVLNNLGIAYLSGSEIGLALDAFEEAATLAPSNATISLNLAVAQQIQGNASAATSTVEEAIKANPENGMLHFMLGYLLTSQGEEPNAATAFQEAANQGISVDDLLAQDPESWAQLFSNWPVSKIQ